MFKITSTKNSGGSHSVVTTAKNYAAIQKALAKAISQHISKNPNTQPIAEVVIYWSAPIDRKYSYKVEAGE